MFQSELQAAAAESQRVIAGFGGTSPTGKNFTLAGTEYQGTIRETESLDDPVATGQDPKRVLLIAATKTQFASKPSAAARPTVTCTTIAGTWKLTAVEESDLHYFLTCKLA